MSTHPHASPSFESVPQLDLAAQYAVIGSEIRAAIEKVLASQQFVLGPKAPRLPVIEDNGQWIGASYRGRRDGSLGHAACLSFYPTKNLGAYGDAGMVVSNSKELSERIRTLRNHGQTAKYFSSEPGWNNRLDELQAAILRVKLRHLSNWQRARQASAAEYTRLLNQVPGVMPPVTPEGFEHVFHQYTIRILPA